MVYSFKSSFSAGALLAAMTASAHLAAAPSCNLTGVPTRVQILQDFPASSTDGRITAFVTVAGKICTYKGYIAAIPLLAEKALVNGQSVHLHGGQFLPGGQFTSIRTVD